MPTDNNGNYSLPTGYLAVDGTTIQASQHNPPLEDIRDALSARVSRNGSAPMTSPLRFADGTVALPSLTFNTDPATGIYKTAGGFAVTISGVKVAEFLAGGVKGARLIGELVPFTGTTAPALWVIPVGQNLSRAAYPDLWTFAQVEIAAGNQFFTNGDGSTTFGIGDMRGRVPAGRDVAGVRLTTAGGGVDGATMGAVGGAQSFSILQTNLPAVTLPTNIVDPGHGHANAVTQAQFAISSGGTGPFLYGPSIGGGAGSIITPNFTGVSASTPLGGSGTPFKLPQPTLVANYILFAGA